MSTETGTGAPQYGQIYEVSVRGKKFRNVLGRGLITDLFGDEGVHRFLIREGRVPHCYQFGEYAFHGDRKLVIEEEDSQEIPLKEGERNIADKILERVGL